MTEYYFDTFIVGIHHSIPHLIADLLNKREVAEQELSTALPNRRSDIEYFIKLIDKKLSILSCDVTDELEQNDRTYWVNELGRVAAIEINTYGRIKPDTLEKMLCLDDDSFVEVQSIAVRLTQKMQHLEYAAQQELAPVPPTMPVQS
jgi:hypothetical protein